MPRYDEPRDTIPAPSDFCDCAFCAEAPSPLCDVLCDCAFCCAEVPSPLCDVLCDCPVCHPPRPLAFHVTDEAD